MRGLDDAGLVETRSARGGRGRDAPCSNPAAHFGPDRGVTGVALLAEFHISIHTWPERGYAALDIFLCSPRHALEAALDVVRTMLRAQEVDSQVIERGDVSA